MRTAANMIYDRKTGEISAEQVYGGRAIRFLYNTTIGGVCVAFLRLPVVSKVYSVTQKGRRSKKKIEKMVNAYGIDVRHDEFGSFNDFITRREERGFERDADVLIAPADSCLLVKPVSKGVFFSLKGKSYALTSFLKDENLAMEYEGGLCLIFRLRVHDYHRFCFVDDGCVESQRSISGFLDSVNTAATGKFSLSSNYREISLLRTSNFGNIVFAEIGAMLVGRIVLANSGKNFRRGDEKGYFEFGGSSIVLLLKKGVAEIDGDILAQSANGIETKVAYGERIGVKRTD